MMLATAARWVKEALEHVGDLALFSFSLCLGVLRGAGRGTHLAVFNTVGYQSIPVISITGLFIGMVLAVQAYEQFAQFGLATSLGQMINVSVVRELGPVLAATMLAGRIGSAMAAELGTMKITEQTDALACLGVNPVQYLGAPRLLACVLLIPLLTVLANFMGVLGGAMICTWVYNIEPHFYWQNTRGAIDLYDLTTGLIKPTAFGATIAIVSCHRGLKSGGGAEGVGKAATHAFVDSFMAILVLDFFLALFLNNLRDYLWPSARAMV